MSDAADFLSSMARASEARASSLADGQGTAVLERRATAAPAPPDLRLSPLGFDLIAEIKMSSPSAGTLSTDRASIEARARAYAESGACAVSVLTEPERFGGSLEDLRRAATALGPLGVPAMAKDFIVAPEQVWAARAEGAGGILLIVRMLEQSRLTVLLELALGLGMFVLLEAFDARDLRRAEEIVGASGPSRGRLLVGLNCRDLRTLTVDPSRFFSLSGRFPAGIPRVAESGIESPEDAAQAATWGYSLALVGTALMKSDDPARLISRMLEAGRREGPSAS